MTEFGGLQTHQNNPAHTKMCQSSNCWTLHKKKGRKKKKFKYTYSIHYYYTSFVQNLKIPPSHHSMKAK